MTNISSGFARATPEEKEIERLSLKLADRDEQIDELNRDIEKHSLRIKELRAEIVALREALRVIATQSLYEWGEKRDSLCSIIDAQRKVAQAALAQGGEERG